MGKIQRRQTYEIGTNIIVIEGEHKNKTGKYICSYYHDRQGFWRARVHFTGIRNPRSVTGDFYVDEKHIMPYTDFITNVIKNRMINACYGMMATSHAEYPVRKPEIDKVYFNNPYTIVIWKDGTKTMVKCQENDVYNPETGLALCISKKALGNTNKWYDVFKKYLPKE